MATLLKTAISSGTTVRAHHSACDQPSEISDRDLLLAINAGLKAFILEQAAVNADLTAKLMDIQSLTRLLEDHEERLAQLETMNSHLDKQNTDLAEELLALKAVVNTAPTTAVPSTEITISGVPLCNADPPKLVAEKVFQSLEIGNLVDDILEIRPLMKKVNSQKNHNTQTTSGSNKAGLSKSFLLTLKSHSVKNYIINKKRSKKDLSVKEVFDTNQSGSIYVNDFLPPVLYNLLRYTKSWARNKGFEHVWIQTGTIFVRKREGEIPIAVRTEDDLNYL